MVLEKKQSLPAEFKGSVVVVADTRLAINQLASRYYGNSSKDLFCVGVTGTNGKTSVAYLSEFLLNEFGWPTAVMGTIDHHFQNRKWTSELTTPDAITLHKRLGEFVALGAKAVAFEVSSHALSQKRADYIPFDVVAFTNLSRDHLDYHADMQSYFLAKQRLFNEIVSGASSKKVYAVINTDDTWGKTIAVADGVEKWTYGQGSADFSFSVLQESFAGSSFQLITPRGQSKMFVPLPGLHNVYNAVASVAIAMAAGASLESCRRGLEKFVGVPGRLQRVKGRRPLNVFVDYAHTDDALKTVLSALGSVRKLAQTKNNIITVFGCGGDRDRGKRPLMTQAAMAGSDYVILTSDNPRTEDPQSIIDDCLIGIDPRLIEKKIFVVKDRRQAIRKSIEMAKDEDVVLIAGKGHEDYQIIGSEKRPFSDTDVALEFLS